MKIIADYSTLSLNKSLTRRFDFAARVPLTQHILCNAYRFYRQSKTMPYISVHLFEVLMVLHKFCAVGYVEKNILVYSLADYDKRQSIFFEKNHGKKITTRLSNTM